MNRAHLSLRDLDVASKTFLDDAERIAGAIVTTDPKSADPFWEQSARSLLKWLIVHVLTDDLYEGTRHLATVRTLITTGSLSVKQARREHLPSSHALLWRSMAENNALDGRVAAEGTRQGNLSRDNASVSACVLSILKRHTDFLDSAAFRGGNHGI